MIALFYMQLINVLCLKLSFRPHFDTFENEFEKRFGIIGNFYKISITISSYGKRKRGGAMLITNLVFTNNTP